MSVDSREYNCTGSGVVTPTGAAGGWCLKANGHPRMDSCCPQYGNGTVFVQDDCFAWCDIEDGKTSDFRDCLKSGSNSSIAGLSCSAEYSGDHDDDESASTPSYSAPKLTLPILFCGMLALSVLYI